MAAERRVFRVAAGAVAETLMVRAAGNTAEATDYFNVASGKVLRLTDCVVTTLVTTDTIIRLRKGQTTGGEEILRVVTPSAMTYAHDFRTPFRVDGGNAGQDLALTCEEPGASPANQATALLVGAQD